MTSHHTSFVNGTLDVTSDLNVSTAVGDPCVLTSFQVGSGSSISDVSDDTALTADSDTVLASQHAVKTYTDVHDITTLAAANNHSDSVALHTLVPPYACTGISPTQHATIHCSESGHTNDISLSYNASVFTISATDNGDVYANNAPITVQALVGWQGLVVDDIIQPRQASQANMYHMNCEFVPFTIPGIPAPEYTICRDYAAYRFPGTSDATYFARVTVPYDAEQPAYRVSKVFRYTIKFSTPGTATTAISITTKMKNLTVGDAITSASTNTITLTPRNVAHSLKVTQFATTIQPSTIPGSTLLLSLTRNGSTDVNNNDLYIWGIHLQYAHYAWGAKSEILV